MSHPLIRTGFALLLLSGAPARSQAADWRLDTEVLTDAPLQIALGMRVLAPNGLGLSTSIGMVPGLYGDLIDSVGQSLGDYSDETSDLVRSSLEQSMVWRVRGGWKPWTDWGLYFELGYGLIVLGGDVTEEEAMSAIIGRPPPSRRVDGGIVGPGASYAYEVGSTLHTLGGEVGWLWALSDDWSIRAALGFVTTISAHSTVDVTDRESPSAGVDAFSDSSEAYLDDLFTSYVHAPTVGLAMAYRLF